MAHLEGRIEPANVATPLGMGVMNRALDGYWRIARRGLTGWTEARYTTARSTRPPVV
jgi:hypothetical protein